MNFERKKDPFDALGIGKKQKIKVWLDDMGVENYIINDDYTIDINGPLNFISRGRVELHDHEMLQLPDFIQFNKIDGYFNISNNKLISLKGCPKIVTNNFWCSRNDLDTLEYCLKIVGGSFICHHNATYFNKDYILKICNTSRSKIQN